MNEQMDEYQEYLGDVVPQTMRTLSSEEYAERNAAYSAEIAALEDQINRQRVHQQARSVSPQPHQEAEVAPQLAPAWSAGTASWMDGPKAVVASKSSPARAPISPLAFSPLLEEEI